MALQLIKLLVTASSTTTTKPTVQRFYHITNDTTEPGQTLTIEADEFFDDNGAEVQSLPELSTDNSYYNVYVNGVLQVKGLSTYTPTTTEPAEDGSLVITVTAESEELRAGTPIVLEVVNYAPETVTTIET